MVPAGLLTRPVRPMQIPVTNTFSNSNFSGMEIEFIGDTEKSVLVTDPKNFPFLSFERICLIYSGSSTSIDDKLRLLHNQLQLFITAFSDLKEITLIATINQNDQSQFHDHSQLLEHLREQLLPICDSSPFYSFHIDFQSNKDGAANFIAEILQMGPITRCQEVSFYYDNETFIQLPVEVISNWLNRGKIGSTETGQSKKERMLKLEMNYRIKIQNAVEMCDHMKMVIKFYFILDLKS